MKNNLPVILLKNLVLLPYQETKLEIHNEISKKAIESSRENYDSQILVVCPINNIDGSPDIEDLPKIGVVASIKSSIKLPNNALRVILDGKRRVKVFSYINYSNDEDVLESIVQTIEVSVEDEIEEQAYLRKLKDSLKKFIEDNTSVSSATVNQIMNIDNLEKLTDLISNLLPLTFEKKISLMLNASAISRSKILLKELFVELAINEIDTKLEKELEDSFDKTQKKYVIKEKINIMKKELGEETSKENDIEYYNKVLSSKKIPAYILDKIIKEMNRYSLTPEASPELIVIKNYIDTLLSFPYLEQTKEEKSIDKIEKRLLEKHYGLIKAKERILEYIAVKNYSGVSPNPIICLIGPPGTGKTTFASSVSYALNRKFAKISLSGLNDPSELTGHRRTYVAASPGKIVSALVKTKVNNPVILLDEVDKITTDYKGDPSAVLLDILDKSGNNKFIDNYLNEEIDLSNVFFILTANEIEKIPIALKDRLEIIKIDAYTTEDKILIAKNYLIKNILFDNGLLDFKFKISDEVIECIINNYTRESGVRSLERALSQIVRKSIKELKNKKVKSVSIKKENIEKYLGAKKYNKIDKLSSCVHALGVTSSFGSIIDIEVTSFKGNNDIITTGNISKNVKDSIIVALSYIKSNKELFNIKDNYFDNIAFHINFKNSLLFKDGPSAGLSILIAIMCYIKKKTIPASIVFTGEISLNGDILKVGSIKEKLLLSSAYNIKEIYLPFGNKEDAKQLNINNNINIKYVNNFDEIYKIFFS